MTGQLRKRTPEEQKLLETIIGIALDYRDGNITETEMCDAMDKATEPNTSLPCPPEAIIGVLEEKIAEKHSTKH